MCVCSETSTTFTFLFLDPRCMCDLDSFCLIADLIHLFSERQSEREREGTLSKVFRQMGLDRFIGDGLSNKR